MPTPDRMPHPPGPVSQKKILSDHERELRRNQRPVANSTGAPPRISSAPGYGSEPGTTALDGSGSGSFTLTLGSDAKNGFGVYFLSFSGASGADVGFVNFGSTGPVGVPLDAGGDGILPIPWPTSAGASSTVSGYAAGATGGTFAVTAYYPI